MNSSRIRKITLIYLVLLVLCGIGYAKYDSYGLDGDAVAFMDIADALRAHDFAHVVNGYWNPAYAAMLAAGQAISHPSRWNELQTFYWVNFWIYLGCLAACVYFVRSLVLVRERYATDASAPPAFSSGALLLVSLALMFASFQRELHISAVRSDSLLLMLLMIAASLLLRLQAGGGFLYYPLLGLTLGLSYLTKSFAFLPSFFLLGAIFLFGLFRGRSNRNRIVAGSVLAGIVFVLLAGPYILAISKQRGRPTTGESARLNYAFFVDQTDRWHEFHTGNLGHATASFKHPEQLLLDSPPVYSYLRHPYGTYPIWFDPAYWTDTIQPHVYLKGHLLRLARCSALLVRFIVAHLEAFVVLIVLLVAGAFFSRKWRGWLPVASVALWGLLMLGIYFPVDLQDRYLAAPFLFVVITMLALLRRPANSNVGDAATITALLLALLLLVDATADIAQRRRILSVTGYPRGAYSTQIYPAASGLNQLGITSGQTVACFGSQACYVDHYWARLAGTPIRAEIEVSDFSDPGAFWTKQQNKEQALEQLRSTGVTAVVGFFSPSAHIPDGWQQLGDSNFYAYLLR